MESSKPYYAARSGWCYELRQERFRGMNHPHDVMVIASTPDELRAIANTYFPEKVDFSGLNQEDSE